jgi:hypothetical protein
VARPEPTVPGPRGPRRVSKRAFYGSSLTEAERVDLRKAGELKNLEEEIAVLRVRLKTALKDHPEDYALLVRGIGMLVRAVAAQYRLSPRSSKDLSESLAAVLTRFGDIIMPADR